MKPRLLLAVVGLCAGLLHPAVLSPLRAADPPGVAKYRGIHPLWPHGNGFCYIEVAHVHKKRPSDLRVYRVLPNEEHLFVGDPIALGYVGEARSYFGPHPLEFSGLGPAGKLYCYLRTPHFHAQETPPSTGFVSKAGVHWFVGDFPSEFERDRHNLWINDSGAMENYQPPKVTIADAPPGYRFPAVAEARPVVEAPPSVPSDKPSKVRPQSPSTARKKNPDQAGSPAASRPAVPQEKP